jgi:hypothetical protein
VVGLTGARFGGAAGRRSRAAVEPPEADDAVTPGAQIPSLLRHLCQKQEAQDPEQEAAEGSATQLPPGPQQADPQPEIAPRPVPRSDEAERVDGTDWDTSKETYELVRPYSLTEGRTVSCVALAVEALVSATGHPPDPVARPEYRRILELCATPHSVAELAALLSMPLGVARVLLGDLVAAGHVAVHRTVGSAEAVPDFALLQRVRTGLQRL